MPDALHLSEHGYTILSQALQPILDSEYKNENFKYPIV